MKLKLDETELKIEVCYSCRNQIIRQSEGAPWSKIGEIVEAPVQRVFKIRSQIINIDVIR